MTAITLRSRRPDPLKTWRLASFGVAWWALAWAALDIRMMFVHNVPLASDAKCYWMEWRGPLYDATVSLWLGHFNYSPVAALAFWPLAQLPLTAFVVVWTAIGTAAYVWLLAPLPLPARLPAMAAGFLFCLNGNIEWVLALVAIFGLRWPALWLIALFTKVAPFVGFGWFVIRGEWRSVAWTAGLAVALIAISALLLPGAWPTWVGMLRTLGSEAQATTTYNSLMPPIPLAVRALAAIVLVWWGARNNRPVVLPLVLALSQPDWQPWAFGLLAAVPRLLRLPEPVDRDDRVGFHPARH
ncbi:MAG TPA: glycosyltransferase family 87 protein [Candidatus Limnocylindrales bacterium]